MEENTSRAFDEWVLGRAKEAKQKLTSDDYDRTIQQRLTELHQESLPVVVAMDAEKAAALLLEAGLVTRMLLGKYGLEEHLAAPLSQMYLYAFSEGHDYVVRHGGLREQENQQ